MVQNPPKYDDVICEQPLRVYTEQFYFDSETHHSYFDIPIPFDS